MKSKSRSMLAVLLLAALAAAGCNKADKPAASADEAKKTDAAAAKGDQTLVQLDEARQQLTPRSPAADDMNLDGLLAEAVANDVAVVGLHGHSRYRCIVQYNHYKKTRLMCLE